MSCSQGAKNGQTLFTRVAKLSATASSTEEDGQQVWSCRRRVEAESGSVVPGRLVLFGCISSEVAPVAGYSCCCCWLVSCHRAFHVIQFGSFLPFSSFLVPFPLKPWSRSPLVECSLIILTIIRSSTNSRPSTNSPQVNINLPMPSTNNQLNRNLINTNNNSSSNNSHHRHYSKINTNLHQLLQLPR